MYRLVLYILIGLVGIATTLAYTHQLSFSPLALLLSTAFLVMMCWAANSLLAAIFQVPTSAESVYITALILALIFDPAKSFDNLPVLGWAAILAMSSKYVLALYNKHLFNPAAIAAVITAFALKESASWWIGTASMLPAVLIGGYFVVRKLREERIIGLFLAAALTTICVVSIMQKLSLVKELQQLLLASPLFFFATIMFTEPLTMPPTKKLRDIYALLVGVLFIPQLHVGPIYSTPELALVVGNLYSYGVSPKHKVLLKLRRKSTIAANIVDFVFKPSHRLAYQPGQYMEFTLAHSHADSRGNRRYFTLASSPTEENLRLGVRFYPEGSSFKQALSSINKYTNMLAGQVAGDFTLPKSSKQKLVFIAGGIGITPFRSMLKFLIDTRQSRDIAVFYVNKTMDEIAYTDVLTQAQKLLGTRVFYTLTDIETVPQNWRGLTGRINANMIGKLLPDYQERSFYLSGPPEMVRATEHLLKQIHVNPKQIKKDFFPGLV